MLQDLDETPKAIGARLPRPMLLLSKHKHSDLKIKSKKIIDEDEDYLLEKSVERGEMTE